jgi:hypothetical protein
LNIPSPVPTTLATLVFRQFCRLLICCDNSWALIQCHRLLALTHESTIW